MILLWMFFRELAMQRHELLVNAFHPPGPDREAAMARHTEIVKRVYGA